MKKIVNINSAMLDFSKENWKKNLLEIEMDFEWIKKVFEFFKSIGISPINLSIGLHEVILKEMIPKIITKGEYSRVILLIDLSKEYYVINDEDLRIILESVAGEEFAKERLKQILKINKKV